MIYDIFPHVFTSTIQSFITQLFLKGQEEGPHLLIVLEEAHHYMRTFFTSRETQKEQELLAYERLAKEGRKFKVSLWISTQRPSEVSPTVLSQCGTWFCLRLMNKRDIEIVSKSTSWVGMSLERLLPNLDRQEAIAFGVALPTPLHIHLCTADPTPKSEDPDFLKHWSL